MCLLYRQWKWKIHHNLIWQSWVQFDKWICNFHFLFCYFEIAFFCLISDQSWKFIVIIVTLSDEMRKSFIKISSKNYWFLESWITDIVDCKKFIQNWYLSQFSFLAESPNKLWHTCSRSTLRKSCQSRVGWTFYNS